MPRSQHILRAGFFLATLPTLVWALSTLAATHDTRQLVHLAGAVVLVYFGFSFQVDLSTRSNPHQYWSVYGAFLTFLLLVLGPAITVVACVVASVVRDGRDRKPLAILLENAAIDALAIFIAGVSLFALGGAPGEMHLPGSYLPLLVATVVLPIVQLIIFSALSVLASERPRAALRDNIDRFPRLARQNTIECLSGLALAVVYMLSPWAVPVIVPLIVSVYLAVKYGVGMGKVAEAALESFANVVDERDPYTFQHSSRVSELSMQIGEQLELPEREMSRLFWTSRLHDLGKIAIDNAVLNKPGRLTDEEFEIMKTHPVVSAKILSSFRFNELEADIVLCHHERYDGRGYLNRTSDTVPFLAYIIAVADTFDAMTSDRPYRKGMPAEVAYQEIHRNLGTQFHPVAGQAFLDAMGWGIESMSESERIHAEYRGKLGSAGSDRAVRPETTTGEPTRDDREDGEADELGRAA